MFSICIQSDQDLLTDMKKKNTHSSHARPKTKASGQLVGIADYMSAGLEVNDNRPMQKIVIHLDNGTYNIKGQDKQMW